ncbi:hypothetical protein PESHB5_09200 [Pediococcus parvulus]
MIINPTKKALPIFNKLVKTKDAGVAKRFAMANPFFSWHANYYLLNRKKVLLLVNDLTYASVVLYDINAQNKAKLDRFIADGIREAFLISGIGDKDIKAYFEMAGNLEINAGFNRQVTGIMTNMILMAQYMNMVDPRKLVQVEMMEWFMETPQKQKGYIYAKEAIQKAFEIGLKIEVSAPELPENAYKVTKTWANFHNWDKYEDDQSLLTGNGTKYEQVKSELQANNKLLLEEFQNYLTQSEGLSKKVVTRHVGNAEFFIDEFLTYYTIATPLRSAAEAMEYFADWFPRKAAYSTTELKANATSIRKFIKFLQLAGEISQDTVEMAKEGIKEGMELGTEYLQMNDDWN